MTQNNSKRVIAITGGIGSGKSAVSKIMSAYGVVFSCDEINKEMLEDNTYLDRLKQIFPEAFPDGVFNKKQLANVIFSDENRRAKLNAISHPEIMNRLLKKIISAPSDVIFVEVPLLSGTAFEKLFREIIVVKADEKIRIERIMERDKVSEKEALAKIRSQINDPQFGCRVYEINNSGSQEDLFNACDRLIKNILPSKGGYHD